MSGSNPWKQDKRLKINSEKIQKKSIYFLIWKTLVLHETMSCPISTKPHNPDVDDEIAQYKKKSWGCRRGVRGDNKMKKRERNELFGKTFTVDNGS